MIWLTMQKLTFVPSYWDPCTMDHISEDLFPDPYDESFCIGSTNLSSEKSLQHQQKYVRYFQRPLQDRSASHHPAPLRKRAGSRCSPAWWLVHAYTYTYTYLPNIHTYMHYFLSFFLSYLLTYLALYIYNVHTRMQTLNPGLEFSIHLFDDAFHGHDPYVWSGASCAHPYLVPVEGKCCFFQPAVVLLGKELHEEIGCRIQRHHLGQTNLCAMI